MKAYVYEYHTKSGKEIEDERWTSPRFRQQIEHTVVAFGGAPNPKWPLISRSEAQTHCNRLRDFGIHVDDHDCDFSVEKISEDGFAIVCLTHPLPSKHAMNKRRW
jgi:hypothetical protein